MTVGTFRQHEEWQGEQCAYCANDGNAATSVLVQDDLHRLVDVHPRRSHLDPHVERRLVSVNHYRLLLIVVCLNYFRRLINDLVMLSRTKI